MKLFNIIANLVSLAAVFSYINHRFVRLPNTIGLMLIALLVSLGLIGFDALGFGIKGGAQKLIESIDFDETLLHGTLSFLLFAGALHINLADLFRQKWIISLLAMSAKTRENLDTFWELVDEILNAVPFVLIGLEILIFSFERSYLVAGLLLIPLLLIARFVSVGLPVVVLRRFRSFSPHVVKILTWGGLRGGISVAMALSLQLQQLAQPGFPGHLIHVSVKSGDAGTDFHNGRTGR
jgi:NhaP-type Na+/H+ or K+/H+ antiporter